mgnify:FL=1
MDRNDILSWTSDFPAKPGVYLFYSQDFPIYIGKAVNLRSRIRSYTDPRSPRIQQMVQKADRIDISITNTETQALLLEANLIKRHAPKYNVRLRDDKSYPLIQISNHAFPRIEVTRDPDTKAKVYGPFTDRKKVDETVKAIRETFGIRGCSDHKFSGRSRPCLDYDLGLCTAPCVDYISQDQYLLDVSSAEAFFHGATGTLLEPLLKKMDSSATNQQYEQAATLRDRIDAVRGLHGGGDAVQKHGESKTTDVLAVSIEGTHSIVSRFHIEKGMLLDREQHLLDTPDHSTPETVLSAFISQYYADRLLPNNLVLSDRPHDSEIYTWLDSEHVEISTPTTGREAVLVEMALKNARQNFVPTDAILALQNSLSISKATRIEAFDISHSTGEDVVGSNVVFVDGYPEKSSYRRLKLKETNDDYSNMYDLLAWRADRSISGTDSRPDPDLLIVDGGSGQLNAALKALSDLKWDVPVIALKKPNDIIITPTGNQTWPSNASHLHLIQRIRDEAHRFALTYHRHLRDDVTTTLDSISGIGPELRKRLFQNFGSIDGIRRASVVELCGIQGIGKQTAMKLKNQL